MKILFLADFREDSSHFLLSNSRLFSKGFVRNGHDVLEFGYREKLLQKSPFKSKNLAVKLAKDKTDRLLMDLARDYSPDIVFITTFKLLDSQTIARLKEVVPNAMTICWYSDMFDGVDPDIAPVVQECDWFLCTGGGSILEAYKRLGVPHCAFMPNPCDPDIAFPRRVAQKWHCDLLFTGKLMHGRGRQDELRKNLISHLVDKKNLTLYGTNQRPAVRGVDYLNAICGAKIAISINAYNHIRFYHSDRLIHYLACGAFVLAKQVPDSDLLFEGGKHLCYFDTQEQCEALIDRYLLDKSERVKIAHQGMQHAHESFHYATLAKQVIELATTGTYHDCWREVI